MAERLAGRAERGRQRDGEGADQPQAVASVRGADVRRAHPRAEVQVLMALAWPEQQAHRVAQRAGGRVDLDAQAAA